MSSWTFNSPEDLAKVVAMEFPNNSVDTWLEDRARQITLSYGYLLHIVGKAA